MHERHETKSKRDHRYESMKPYCKQVKNGNKLKEM